MSVIRQLHQQLVSKTRSAVEITQTYLDRITTLEPQLRSFLTVTAEVALAQAEAIDAQLARGEALGPLAGIPIGLPTDMPKAWFVALASLSKSATPKRVKNNAVADHLVVKPAVRKTRLK